MNSRPVEWVETAVPNITFGAAAPLKAALSTEGEALTLESAFEELGPGGARAEVRLAHLANHLRLVELRRFLHRATHLLRPGGELVFVTRDPDDVPAGTWPGEVADFEPPEFHRPLRHVLELLRLYPLRPRTPHCFEPAPDSGLAGRFLVWRAERLADEASVAVDEVCERYGRGTRYRRFDRLEEPEIADDLYYAASRLRLRPGERVLSLGVNDGRELEIFEPEVRAAVELWGLDHSESAVALARERLPEHAARLRTADLAALPTLGLPRFDVVLALNVLQCTSVDRDRLLADLKPLMSDRARLLASIPNCHFGPGDILRRPLRRDDPRHDRSLVHKDLRYLTRELYRSGFGTVESFGTYDAFLLARRGRGLHNAPSRGEPGARYHENPSHHGRNAPDLPHDERPAAPESR